MTSWIKILLVSTPVLLASAALADTVMIPSNLDNTLYDGDNGELSNGVGPTMFAGRTFQGVVDRRRALVAFDVAGSIPAGSTINSAVLQLTLYRTVSGNLTNEIHRVTASWGEGTSNATLNGGSGTTSTPNDATWAHRFFNTVFWTNLGGDFVAAPSASQSVGGAGVYTWGSTAQMVSDVQDWLDTPAGNFGWLVLGDESTLGTAKAYFTREAPIAGNRPKLIVDYSPAVIPVQDVTWGRIKALYQ